MVIFSENAESSGRERLRFISSPMVVFFISYLVVKFCKNMCNITRRDKCHIYLSIYPEIMTTFE